MSLQARRTELLSPKVEQVVPAPTRIRTHDPSIHSSIPSSFFSRHSFDTLSLLIFTPIPRSTRTPTVYTQTSASDRLIQ